MLAAVRLSGGNISLAGSYVVYKAIKTDEAFYQKEKSLIHSLRD